MIRGLAWLAAVALSAPALASDAIRLGSLDPAIPSSSDPRPLRVEIESGLQFSRLALVGQDDGQANIDPQTGAKHVSNMIDLGGLSWQGHAKITGEPLRPVRIELPPRIVLRSADGSEAVLTDFVTNLPPVSTLDENGMLEFAFGARLSSKDAKGGNFRGRVRIEVDYY